MNNFSFIVGSQIRFLTSNLTRKNFKANVAEINHLVNLYGHDAYLYLLRCLVDQIDLKDQKGQKDQLKIQLLKDELNHLAKQPNFINVICQTLEGIDSIHEEFISQFSKVLKLPLAQEILVALAVAHSIDPAVQQEGVKYLKVKLPELTQSSIKTLPDNVLHNLTYFMKTNEGFTSKSSFLKALLKLLPQSSSLAAAPMALDFPTTSKRVDANAASIVGTFAGACHAGQLMEDVGYACTSSSTAFKELLSQFSKLKEQDVALILGVMSRTHTSADSGGEDNGIPFTTSFPVTTPAFTPDTTTTPTSWNVNVFVDTIKELYPKLNWPQVIKHLDHPGFLLLDQKGLALIMSIYRKATKEQFPLDVLFDDIWTNTTGQLSFLKLALAAPPDVFNFAAAPRRQPPIDGLHPPGGKASLSSPWYSLALIETLLRLAETDHHTAVRTIFEQPMKHCPELLLIGLAQVKPSWNNILRAELVSALLHIFLSNHSNSSLVLHRLWHINPSLVIRGMIEMYFKDQTSLSRLLDVAQDLKALSTILDSRPFSFALDLAALASHREYLYLEKWLQDHVNEHGVNFAAACIAYLQAKLKARAEPGKGTVGFALSPEILTTFFKVLHNNATLLTPSLLDELRSISPKPEPTVEPQMHVAQPATSPVVPGGPNPTNVPGGIPIPPVQGQGPAEHVFPADIEEEANSYFQKIYTGQISITDIVILLKGFKTSKNPRELDIFACMIHNLFDEYRFFPKYPDKELRITGILFGSLIQHQLVSFLSLGLALRQVLEALRKPLGTKMFKFGLFALEQFKPRLCEWPQYCSQILLIPHIRQQHPEIIEFIEKSLSTRTNVPSTAGAGTAEQPQLSPVQSQSPQPQPQSQPQPQPQPQPQSQPPPQLQPQPQPQPQAQNQTQIQAQAQAQTQAQAQPTQPQPHFPQSTALKIPPGFQEPTAAPRTTTPPPPQPAAISPPAPEGFDQHPLGTALLLKSTREIVQPDEATKDKMQFIINNLSLQNMDIKTNELKELLKPEYFDYLAQYLVVKRVSIEQNFHQMYLTFLEKLNFQKFTQLILAHTHENIKTLLRSEKLKVDISERSVLKHLGSWLGMITLAKNKPLYHKDIAMKDLLCLAYDQTTLIAVVPFVAKVLEACAASKVFKPPNPWVMGILRLLAEIYQLPDLKINLRFEIELLCSKLQVDLNEIKPTTTLRDRKLKQQLAAQEGDSKHTPEPVSTNGSVLIEPTTHFPPAVDFSNLAQYIVYNPQVNLLAQHPMLKRAVPAAIERAIREIIAPVVERSVTIAVTTTKELVLKDFATEPDENKVRRAAHLMVQNLAGNLALVTCKEPLRVSMANHLRASFQITNEHLMPLVEHAISVLCAENLDLACAIIEKAATEKAIRETDEVLGPAYTARRKHRERPTGQPFLDMTNLVGRYSATIPDGLRPRAGGLLAPQLRIYEDFLVPAQPQVVQKTPSSPAGSGYSGVEPSPIPEGAVAERPVPSISIVPHVTHTNKMQYVVHQGTVNQPQDTRRASISGDLSGTPGIKTIVQDSIPVQEALDRFAFLTTEMEKHIARVPSIIVSLSSIHAEHEIHTVMGKLSNLIAQTVPRSDAAVAFAQKAFFRLFEDERKLLRDAYLTILETLRDASKKVTVELTNWVLSDDERKFNLEVVVGLIHHHLLSLPEFDEHMAKSIESGRQGVLEFIMHVIVQCLVDAHSLAPAEFGNIFDVLSKLAQRPNAPESLIKVLEEVRHGKDDRRPKLALRESGPALSGKDRKEESEPSGLREQVVSLFQEWLMLCIQPGSNDKAVVSYIAQLQQQGLFKVDEISQPFFRVCTEIAIENCFAPGGDKPESMSYQTVDAFAKLLFMLVKYSDANSKAKLLNRILTIVIKVLIKDYELKKLKFNQRPYFRLFDNLLIDFNTPDPAANADASPLSSQILHQFSIAFAALQPSKFQGFAFAWLELISHRMFMPKLLLLKGQKGWPLFQQLLVELFRFLEPYLRNADLNDPIRLLYKGTLRVLLVLLHDFPEFLCDYHFCFCDVIPPSCIQMRNLILSAFPRSMRLPDPFTPNLKVDLLPEINQPPRVLFNCAASLATNNFKAEIDSYLKTRSPVNFLVEMRPRFLMLPQQPNDTFPYATKYNVPVINALVLHVGMQAILQLQNKSSQVTPPIAHSAPMDIFQHLALDLDTEGRYLFLNAIANQLRYPNNHTHYFSCVLLYLFAEASQEIIQEQITRVLLERLIVNRPHPWGLLITFIELIKNPRYNFWSHSFTRCAPEIERLFESVARSCMGREPAAKTELLGQPQATVVPK